MKVFKVKSQDDNRRFFDNYENFDFRLKHKGDDNGRKLVRLTSTCIFSLHQLPENESISPLRKF